MSDDKKDDKKIKISNDEKNGDKNMPDREEFQALLEKNDFKAPQVSELVKGKVITASKAEVKLDIGGILTGVVRGPELYEDDEEYADLKPGDEVDATVIDDENENGDMELSFRIAGQERAWAGLRESFKDKTVIKVRIVDANKGGALAKYRQISGFLPVSQLAPENYPRVSGADRNKILEKLRSFVGREFEVKVVTLNESDDKIIFSEKEAWNERQKGVISKYKIGTKVKGKITAITDFGVFINFGDNLEGLIHISELAWQRIDNPSDLYKSGEIIEAEVISLDNAKIFLSAKKLLKDPWHNVDKKYKLGQSVEGKILKVNPFGLFVKLDEDIHGLAHISQLGLAPGQRIYDVFKPHEKKTFEVVSMEPKEHRLGLAYGLQKESQKHGKHENTETQKDTVDKKEDKKDKKEKKEDGKKADTDKKKIDDKKDEEKDEKKLETEKKEKPDKKEEKKAKDNKDDNKGEEKKDKKIDAKKDKDDEKKEAKKEEKKEEPASTETTEKEDEK